MLIMTFRLVPTLEEILNVNTTNNLSLSREHNRIHLFKDLIDLKLIKVNFISNTKH